MSLLESTTSMHANLYWPSKDNDFIPTAYMKAFPNFKEEEAKAVTTEKKNSRVTNQDDLDEAKLYAQQSDNDIPSMDELDEEQLITRRLVAKGKTVPTQPSTTVKNGVEELFNVNPGLSPIGTPQQYSAYLDTIFPDSKVKDIVYHGTKGKKFDEVDFSKNIFGGNVFYVSTDKREAKGYAKKEGSIVSLLINAKNVQFQRDAFFGNRPQSKAEIQAEIDAIKNSKFALEFIGEMVEIEVFPTLAEATEFSERNSGWEPLTESVKQNKLKELNNALVTTEEFDTVLTNNDAGERTIYIVNQAEQIYILGNQKDIEGFKKFVANNPNSGGNNLEGFDFEVTKCIVD
jgi:hypothetical protein